MKALFVHDTKMVRYQNKYYDYNLNASLWKNRYLEHFDQLTVLTRCIDVQTSPVEQLNESNTDGVEFDCLSIGANPMRLATRLLEIYKKIKNAIEKPTMGCVIARLPSVLGLVVVYCARKKNRPYLIEMVGCAWDGLWNHSLLGKLTAPWLYLITKHAVKNAPYVVYVTNEFLQRRYPTKGKNTNISNVALTKMEGSYVIQKRIKRIKTEKTKLILGTAAAANVRYKGQEYVIKALALMKREGITQYEYQIVGAGNQSYLRGVTKSCGVEDQVKFLGALPHERIFNWLDGIDIYIQPSRQEGLPRALIEAMSRGLPAIGADTGGIPELLDKQFIFSRKKSRMPREIADKLRQFTPDNMTEQAGRNLRIAQEYESEVLEKRRQEFFKDFVLTSGMG